MRFLITGGTGYLGSHFAEAMLARGHAVAILKRPASPLAHLSRLSGAVQLFDCDAQGIADALASTPRVDAVVHCATCYGRSGECMATLVDANVRFPLSLLESAAAAGVPRFVNVDTALPPATSPYARSKRQFRDWLETFSNRIDARNLVLDQFFGPGEDPSKFVSFLIARMLARVEAIPLTPGGQVRNFLPLSDVLDALARVATADPDGGPGYRHFEAAAPVPLTVRDFAERVRRLCRADTRLDFGAIPYRPNEMMRSEMDGASLAALGWKPEPDIEKALAEVIAQDMKTRGFPCDS